LNVLSGDEPLDALDSAYFRHFSGGYGNTHLLRPLGTVAAGFDWVKAKQTLLSPIRVQVSLWPSSRADIFFFHSTVLAKLDC